MLAPCVTGADTSVQRANLANYAGRDHLGRELVSAAETGGEKGRQVGLFYYLWHGQHGTQGPYDISKMEAIDPKVMEKPDSPLWPDPSRTPMLHWGEPLFGYYLSTDEWVLRRHVQMFIDAGIDVLYFDTTNGYHYREVTEKLFAILQEFHDKGYKAPKFFYYMAPARRGCGTSNVRDVWDNYYSKGRFRDLWFEWNGKPLIVTHPDRPYPQALQDGFTFRRPTWGTPSVPDTWYWAGMPKQNVAVSSDGKREMIALTLGSPDVALDVPRGGKWKPGTNLGCSEGYWGAPIQGRSWHDGHRDTRPNAVHYGFFFQKQIDWALAKEREDVPLALVCQWNEWLVPFLTRKTNDLYGMPHWIRLQDEYNIEYSRDIEPMKGGYRDAYLFQLMNFVRRFKGLPAPAKATRRTPALSAADSGWNSVSPVFEEMTGDGEPRNHPGYDACGVYTNDTVVNEFASLRVAVGEDGVIRFLAETVKPVRIVDEKSMNLLLRVAGKPVNAMGYTHCLTPKGASAESKGRRLVYSVRADALGIDVSRPFSIEFKWSDNRQADDPMDFYVNGDAAPRGRLNWRFDFGPPGAVDAAHAARLMFHVPFDGSPVAAVAKGNARPQIVRGLEYAPGVDGQAVRLTAKAKSVLQYVLAGNVLPEKGSVSLWMKREWADAGRDASGKERWRTLFSFPQPCKDFGSGALSLWWWAERLRIDITDYGHTHVFRNDVPPPDGKWEHVVFTWDERAKEAKLYHNGRRYRQVSDNTGPMAAVISRKVGAPFTFDRPGFDRFFVGCLGDGRQFDGLVDDFRIYAEALSDAEVAALFSEHSQLAEPPQEKPDYAALFAKDGPNPHEGGERLDLDFVVEYRFDAESMARYRREKRFRAVGDVTENSLGGVPYLEAGTNLNDRFAFMFDVDPSVPLYCFDFVYPDDAKRTCDLLVQFKAAHGDDYTLQVGYFTGDEYPNTGKMLTHRCLYWTTPGRGGLAMIAMTARAGVPAALAALRIHKVKDAKLPPLTVREPKPAGGWNRMFGMCWEDPAIGYDFGTGGHGAKEISALIDRTAAYMKYCGQNVFCYPGVWYKGLIGENYNPRGHAPDFLAAWYEKFDKEGLFFVPNVNANNMEIPAGLVTMDTMTNGALHASPVAIHDTGKPNWGGWHNSPPNFNFFHPDVQAQIERHIDALLGQGAAHPSFKGVCMYLTMHSMNWFGDIRSGYNDYAVRAFAKDRGLAIPIDERDPLRGRASAKWIRANARDAWVQWRCDQVTAFYARMAAKLRARRPDLKLWLNSFVQPDWNWPDFMEDGFMERQAREGGLDRVALAAIPNLILCQTQLPAFCRKRDRRLFPNDETYAFNRVLQMKPSFFALVKDARFPWINQHDLYWENPVGKNKSLLNGDGLVETTWRVTTINPSGYHALRDFVLPLRFGDVLGMSKGGYLVGTYGMEEHLRAFAAAYRALPAVVMKQIGRKGNVVLRQADYDGKSYFYLVNTDYAQAAVVLSVPDGTRDLVTGASLSGDVKLTLAPYQLMSFAAPSGSVAHLP